jgi:flavodoxin
MTVSKMKTLVTYMSQSGNTKKVAEAIYDEIDGKKEIMTLNEVDDLDGFDLVFVGFPVMGAGAPRKVKKFLTRAHGKRVALLATHAMPSSMSDFVPVVPRCQAAADGSDLIGTFECQGQLVPWVAKMLRLHPSGSVRRWAKSGGEDHGAGHPNASDLERARAFAREMVAKHTVAQ